MAHEMFPQFGFVAKNILQSSIITYDIFAKIFRDTLKLAHECQLWEIFVSSMYD